MFALNSVAHKIFWNKKVTFYCYDFSGLIAEFNDLIALVQLLFLNIFIYCFALFQDRLFLFIDYKLEPWFDLAISLQEPEPSIIWTAPQHC